MLDVCQNCTDLEILKDNVKNKDKTFQHQCQISTIILYKITCELARKILVFIHKRLRIILQIKWSDKVSNAEIMVEIKRRK